MMATNMLKVITLLAFIFGAGQATSTVVVAEDANFDDLTPAVPVPGAPATLNPVPVPYRYLAFNGLSLASKSAVAVVPLQPSSGNNFAISSSLTGSADVSTMYSGSKTQSYDLKSLNAGCYATAENGAVAPPVNCTFSFTGTRVTDGSKVVDTFRFGVGNVLGIGTKTMTVQPHSFSKAFTGLKDLSITFADAVLPNIAGATVRFAVDDVKYDVHLAK